jgi:hypothetical protein
MDELESLIAGMPRPEPSAELGRRIEALVNRAPRRNLYRRRARWLVAACACAGAIGFVLGRQTAPRGAEAVASPTPAAHAAEHTAPPLEILASEDQLAGFFIVETAPENAWGRGRPRVEVFSSSSQSRNLP